MIELRHITKTYQAGSQPVHALRDVSFQVNRGEFVYLRGASGSGKTTLLLLVGAMLRPSRGTVRVDDCDLSELTTSKRAAFRASHIGFIFQLFHLVPYLSVLENVMLPRMQVSKDMAARNARQDATELLDQLGMAHRLTHRPTQLSVGEKQRVAVARALINKPPLILADEPTGNLDEENAAAVMNQLQAYQQAGGTILVVSHGPAPSTQKQGPNGATRLIHLREGKIQDNPE